MLYAVSSEFHVFSNFFGCLFLRGPVCATVHMPLLILIFLQRANSPQAKEYVDTFLLNDVCGVMYIIYSIQRTLLILIFLQRIHVQ